MKGKWAIPVIVSILILGTLGLTHAYAPTTEALSDSVTTSDTITKSVTTQPKFVRDDPTLTSVEKEGGGRIVTKQLFDSVAISDTITKSVPWI